MLDEELSGRTLGLLDATAIGVGAIVGGGILALAGVAFATTGPSAILAFGLNGLIALLTALTFAEMATSFPESGGTYTFAKKVLSVEAAFTVGWVVWFASLVAAVLYALGFASFGALLVRQLWTPSGGPAGELGAFVGGHGFEILLALAATAFYTVSLVRRSAGGGRLETWGKVLVFAFLIAAGLWVLPERPLGEIRSDLSPFFVAGGLGLLQAMGYTFIALQGFDLIAAVSGEVKSPRRNLPRAMVGSLLVALAVYIPLLFLISTVGVPDGRSIADLARESPEALVAVAAETYLGRAGFWLVGIAAVLSMLSALQANLLAASRFALAMAGDRNLAGRLRVLDARRGTPVAAVLTSSAIVAVIVVLIPNLAAAGAVSSLIFLLSFALAHWTAYLARRRGGGRPDALRLPFFPLVPAVGGVACLGLALFQGLVVPAAGGIAAVWIAAGAALYVFRFSRRARVADAAAEALDPQLVRLRGRSPLVLVPIANPASAESLVRLASAMAPPEVGRVLLLYVVETPESWTSDDWKTEEPPPQLRYAQEVLGEALTASFASDLAPQALTTLAEEPWEEIRRVARIYDCESLLLGLGELAQEAQLTGLLHEIRSDVVVLRALPGWHLEKVRHVLVPVGGRRDQSGLRARLLGSLYRRFGFEVTYLGIVRLTATREEARRLEREIREIAEDEVPGGSRVEILRRDDVVDALVERAREAELVVLGLRRSGEQIFGRVHRRLAAETESAVLMIRQRG